VQVKLRTELFSKAYR